MAFTEDATEFFDDDDFAVAATITGISSSVYGHFDREFIELGEISGYRPVFTCATDDVVNVQPGTMVQVTGETAAYFVTQRVKIDDIETKLVLEK